MLIISDFPGSERRGSRNFYIMGEDKVVSLKYIYPCHFFFKGFREFKVDQRPKPKIRSWGVFRSFWIFCKFLSEIYEIVKLYSSKGFWYKNLLSVIVLNFLLLSQLYLKVWNQMGINNYYFKNIFQKSHCCFSLISFRLF